MYSPAAGPLEMRSQKVYKWEYFGAKLAILSLERS
jgi:hypothetical protein